MLNRALYILTIAPYIHTMLSKITSKGQITLPMALRRRLGLVPGLQVEFIEDEHGIRMVRHVERADLDAVKGCLKGVLKESSAEYLAQTRGPTLKQDKP